MRPPYSAAPALPAEQQDPKLNPGGGPLGWVVVDADEIMLSFGDGYMSETIAQRRAAALNEGRPGTDVANDEDYHYGHCDTCGAHCDRDGCTIDRTHVAAIA